ncbi:MAG: SnoaL-like domain-containing protein [Anderseniella sp.]|nr:SnoaL-like domain-containing protein [Anderseniella sp.]
MDDLIKKAESYVAASNDHDIGGIRLMLAPECSYRSAGVGAHDGVDAITTMMQSFFAANPDVRWQVEDYRWHSGHVVFDFVIALGGTNSSGVEEIHFDKAGAISRIVVHR